MSTIAFQRDENGLVAEIGDYEWHIQNDYLAPKQITELIPSFRKTRKPSTVAWRMSMDEDCNVTYELGALCQTQAAAKAFVNEVQDGPMPPTLRVYTRALNPAGGMPRPGTPTVAMEVSRDLAAEQTAALARMLGKQA